MQVIKHKKPGDVFENAKDPHFSSADLIYRYYRVGERAGSSSPFACSRENPINQKNCTHDYVIVASSLTGKRGKANIDDEVRGLMGADEIDLYYIEEGSNHFWCWRCGYYLNLNPSRFHRLPKTGML